MQALGIADAMQPPFRRLSGTGRVVGMRGTTAMASSFARVDIDRFRKGVAEGCTARNGFVAGGRGAGARSSLVPAACLDFDRSFLHSFLLLVHERSLRGAASVALPTVSDSALSGLAAGERPCAAIGTLASLRRLR